MKHAFLTWFMSAKRRSARLAKQYKHNVPHGIV